MPLSRTSRKRVAIVGGAGSPCVGRACARDRAVLPEPAMAERLPPRGCFTRFVGNALQTVRAGAAGPASSRLRWVRMCECVRGVGLYRCFFRQKTRQVSPRFFWCSRKSSHLSHESLSRAGFLPYLSATSHYLIAVN